MKYCKSQFAVGPQLIGNWACQKPDMMELRNTREVENADSDFC